MLPWYFSIDGKKCRLRKKFATPAVNITRKKALNGIAGSLAYRYNKPARDNTASAIFK
jgi:hypothetical protein